MIGSARPPCDDDPSTRDDHHAITDRGQLPRWTSPGTCTAKAVSTLRMYVQRAVRTHACRRPTEGATRCPHWTTAATSRGTRKGRSCTWPSNEGADVPAPRREAGPVHATTRAAPQPLVQHHARLVAASAAYALHSSCRFPVDGKRDDEQAHEGVQRVVGGREHRLVAQRFDRVHGVDDPVNRRLVHHVLHRQRPAAAHTHAVPLHAGRQGLPVTR